MPAPRCWPASPGTVNAGEAPARSALRCSWNILEEGEKGQQPYTNIGISASPFLPPAAARLASPLTFEGGREQPTQSTIDRSNIRGHITACSNGTRARTSTTSKSTASPSRMSCRCSRTARRSTLEDKRRNYGEPRYVVLCPLQDVLVHVTYTVRGGNIRLISARRASRREKRDYERRKPDQGRADARRPRAH